MSEFVWICLLVYLKTSHLTFFNKWVRIIAISASHLQMLVSVLKILEFQVQGYSFVDDKPGVVHQTAYGPPSHPQTPSA